MPKSVPNLDNLYEKVRLPCVLVAECRCCVWWVEQWWCSGRTPSSCRSTPSSSSRWSPPWQTRETCSGPPHKSCFPPRWVSSLVYEGLWRPSRMFDLQKFMVTLIWNKSSFVFVHTDINTKRKQYCSNIYHSNVITNLTVINVKLQFKDWDVNITLETHERDKSF